MPINGYSVSCWLCKHATCLQVQLRRVLIIQCCCFSIPSGQKLVMQVKKWILDLVKLAQMLRNCRLHKQNIYNESVSKAVDFITLLGISLFSVRPRHNSFFKHCVFPLVLFNGIIIKQFVRHNKNKNKFKIPSQQISICLKSKVIFSEQQRNLTRPCGMSISIRKLKLASGPQRQSAPNPDPVNHILCLFIVYVWFL